MNFWCLIIFAVNLADLAWSNEISVDPGILELKQDDPKLVDSK